MEGILIIDKPAGLTSHDVVARVRRILHERRVGHTGTLDPFATGVLILLVGRATRLAQFLNTTDKEYEAVIRFGYATDTGDSTGKPLGRTDQITQIRLQVDQVSAALDRLQGEIEQLPPMYSAKKYGGLKLYELARRGETIERKPVRIRVHRFELASSSKPLLKENEDGTVDVAVRVICSAGTYVRTLAESVGELLDIGAHLVELRRTRAGDFCIADALNLDQLKEQVDNGSLTTVLIPSDAALFRMPFVHLSPVAVDRVRNGVPIPATVESAEWANNEKVRMRAEDGTLIAVGYYDAEKRLLYPRVVVAGQK